MRGRFAWSQPARGKFAFRPLGLRQARRRICREVRKRNISWPTEYEKSRISRKIGAAAIRERWLGKSIHRAAHAPGRYAGTGRDRPPGTGNAPGTRADPRIESRQRAG